MRSHQKMSLLSCGIVAALWPLRFGNARPSFRKQIAKDRDFANEEFNLSPLSVRMPSPWSGDDEIPGFKDYGGGYGLTVNEYGTIAGLVESHNSPPDRQHVQLYPSDDIDDYQNDNSLTNRSDRWAVGQSSFVPQEEVHNGQEPTFQRADADPFGIRQYDNMMYGLSFHLPFQNFNGLDTIEVAMPRNSGTNRLEKIPAHYDYADGPLSSIIETQPINFEKGPSVDPGLGLVKEGTRRTLGPKPPKRKPPLDPDNNGHLSSEIKKRRTVRKKPPTSDPGIHVRKFMPKDIGSYPLEKTSARYDDEDDYLSSIIKKERINLTKAPAAELTIILSPYFRLPPLLRRSEKENIAHQPILDFLSRFDRFGAKLERSTSWLPEYVIKDDQTHFSCVSLRVRYFPHTFQNSRPGSIVRLMKNKKQVLPPIRVAERLRTFLPKIWYRHEMFLKHLKVSQNEAETAQEGLFTWLWKIFNKNQFDSLPVFGYAEPLKKLYPQHFGYSQRLLIEALTVDKMERKESEECLASSRALHLISIWYKQGEKSEFDSINLLWNNVNIWEQIELAMKKSWDDMIHEQKLHR